MELVEQRTTNSRYVFLFFHIFVFSPSVFFLFFFLGGGGAVKVAMGPAAGSSGGGGEVM